MFSSSVACSWMASASAAAAAVTGDILQPWPVALNCDAVGISWEHCKATRASNGCHSWPGCCGSESCDTQRAWLRTDNLGAPRIDHRRTFRRQEAPLRAGPPPTARKRKGRGQPKPSIAMKAALLALALATALAASPGAAADTECYVFGPRVDCGAWGVRRV